MRLHRIRPLLPLSAILSLPFQISPAQAQAIPDAGALRQQIEQQRELPHLPPVRPEPVERVPEEKARSGPEITVREFRFAGNTLLGSEQLAAALAGYANRPVGFDALQEAAQAVAAAYREAGWVVSTWLPQQDVTDGNILIQIQEAHFGEARLEGEAPARLSEERWQAVFARAQAAADPVSLKALDRALLLVDDLPGVAAAGSLAPGRKEGETDLLLTLSDEPLVSGSLSIDNHGARSTGALRQLFSANINSPFRLGDSIAGTVLHNEGTQYGRLAYSLPLGSDGLSLRASLSSLDYKLQTQPFAATGARGRSTTYGADLAYPLVRSREFNLYLNGGGENKLYENEANGVVSSKYETTAFTASVVGNLADRLAGGGINEFSAALSRGELSQDPSLPARSDHSEGRFSKLRVTLGRQHYLPFDLIAALSFSGQWSRKNLDSSERFYLGGESGVRAYPVNEGGGKSGQLLNLELRRPLPGSLWLAGFVDYGRVRQFAITEATNGVDLTGGQPNELEYKGYGLSLSWTPPWGGQVKGTLARRIGDNPAPSSSGTDQDGTLQQNRFWLSVSLPFGFTPPPPATAEAVLAAGSGAAGATDLPAAAAAESLPAEDAAAAPRAISRLELIGSRSLAAAAGAAPGEAAYAVRENQGVWLVVADADALEAPAEARGVESLIRMVKEWRAAWTGQDVASYLAHYAEHFVAANGQDKGDWRALRYQRLHDTRGIRVELSDQKIRIRGDQATVSFKQRYQSASYADVVTKTLALQWQGTAWKIVSEQQKAAR